MNIDIFFEKWQKKDYFADLMLAIKNFHMFDFLIYVGKTNLTPLKKSYYEFCLYSGFLNDVMRDFIPSTLEFSRLPLTIIMKDIRQDDDYKEYILSGGKWFDKFLMIKYQAYDYRKKMFYNVDYGN